MFGRIQIIRSRTHSVCRRYYSAPPSPYSDVFRNNKLRAYKFEASPEHALRHMGAWAATLNSSSPTDFLRSLGSLYLPFLETKPPISWSAVYFPGWIFDVEIEGFGTFPRHSFSFRNEILPGANTPLLSVAPLELPQSQSEPFPFTEDLLHQQGQEVQCIPFNVSPFSPFQVLQSCAPDTSWEQAPGVNLRTASIKPRMLAAYPILLPLYVAKYQLGETPGRTITLFISGYKNSTNVMAPNYQGYHEILDMAQDYINRQGWLKFVRDREVQSFLPSLRSSTNAWKDAMVDKLLNSKNISQLASYGPLTSDDDLRVRERTRENVDQLNRYFKLASEIYMFERIIMGTQSADSASKVLVLGRGSGPLVQNVGDSNKMLQAKIEELEEEKRKARPQWWIEWESSSKTESEAK